MRPVHFKQDLSFIDGAPPTIQKYRYCIHIMCSHEDWTGSYLLKEARCPGVFKVDGYAMIS